MLAIQLPMHKDTVGAARSSYVAYHTSYSLTVADEDQMGEDFVGRSSPTSIHSNPCSGRLLDEPCQRLP